MKSEITQTLRGKSGFWIGLFWCATVIGTYHWLNKTYYIEKLSVFIGYLKGMIS